MHSINITKYEYAKFTSFKFYTDLLGAVRDYYQSPNYDKTPPCFSFEEPCFIDPAALPLIIALGCYLKSFHGRPIELHISNVPGTSSHLLTRFLDRSDFFYLAGKNENPHHPIGRNIFQFNARMLGGYNDGGDIRHEHKIKAFSKADVNNIGIGVNIETLSSNDRRDLLIQHFSYVIDNDFRNIFEDNNYTSENKHDLVECLAELITNSLLHSNSDCFASLHTNHYRTSISICDIGRGLYSSLKDKKSTYYYISNDLFNTINVGDTLDLSESSQWHTFSIFEALYYSCLQDRKGLFDLICSIVLVANGTFRIHNYSTQLIISSKLRKEFQTLFVLRKEIYSIHWYLKDENNQDIEKRKMRLIELSNLVKSEFRLLIDKIFKNYSVDMQFSSIRFYNVEFMGVHIESEIPRSV